MASPQQRSHKHREQGITPQMTEYHSSGSSCGRDRSGGGGIEQRVNTTVVGRVQPIGIATTRLCAQGRPCYSCSLLVGKVPRLLKIQSSSLCTSRRRDHPLSPLTERVTDTRKAHTTKQTAGAEGHILPLQHGSKQHQSHRRAVFDGLFTLSVQQKPQSRCAAKYNSPA